MGNAFSAIANDASATFWNPGRLGFLSNREFMIDYRSVFEADATLTTKTNTPDVFKPGNRAGKPQLGFASLVFPVGAEKEHQFVGVSYTLGGYLKLREGFNRSKTDVPDGSGIAGNNITVTQTGTTDLLVRNSYLTVAYGKLFDKKQFEGIMKRFLPKKAKLPGQLGVGIGIFFVDQEFSESTVGTQVSPGQTVSINDTPISARGHGVGVSAGLAYDPSDKWSFGLSYRSATTLSGLDATSTTPTTFNTETPERFTFGTAYILPKLHGQYIVSGELQVFSAANRKLVNGISSQLDRRRAVTNFHLGFEYTPKSVPVFWDTKHANRYSVPVRFGFHTNENAATIYTNADSVFSFGLAFQQLYDPDDSGIEERKFDPVTKTYKPTGRVSKVTKGVRYSFEPTVELQTSSGSLTYTLTGRATF